MAKTYPVRSASQVKDIAIEFLNNGKYRDYAIYMIGINSVLRIGDILNLKFKDLYDFEKQQVRNHIIKTQQKTGKRKVIQLNSQTVEAIKIYINTVEKEYFLPNHFAFFPRSGLYAFQNRHIVHKTFWKTCKDVAKKLDLDCYNFAPHSLRKTKCRLFVFNGPSNMSPLERLVIVQSVLCHKETKTTLDYLGISQDEIDQFHLWSVFD